MSCSAAYGWPSGATRFFATLIKLLYSLPGRSPDHALAREWELRGLMRCSCGSTMGTHTTQPHGGRVYHYYKCKRRSQLGRIGSCAQKSLRFNDVEPVVWRFVSDLLRDPEKIRAGMEKLIDEEQAIGRENPERESRAWAEKLEECARLRGCADRQVTNESMSDEEPI